MKARFISALATVAFLLAPLEALNLVTAPHAQAQEGKYTVKEMRRRFYHKNHYTVADLHWCLLAKKMGYCETFIHGVADAARFSGFRYNGKRLCWPKDEHVPLSQVVGIVMKEKRLQQWAPRDSAAAFILTALVEAYPCKK